MSIFQKSVLNSVKQDESLIAQRWAKYQSYLAKVEAIKGFKEEVYQDGFFKDIFESCLGYTLKTTNPDDYNLEREKKNETDGKKADGVIYVNGEIIGIVELKDQKTKNLDVVEGQAFNYHASHSNSKYIIISNFNELRFYIDKKTAYEKFNLFTLTYDEFKKLHVLICFESLKEDIPLKLKEKSASFEQTISKELYRDFSQFRSHLFENIIKNNYSAETSVRGKLVEPQHPSTGSGRTELDKQTLLRLTQKLCDRIIFILFAEDRNLLKANTVKEIRSRHQQDGFGDRSMYDYYKLYFNAINTGNDKLGIPKYNGGLFATDEMLDSLKIDDSYLDMEAQKLSDFDFESDISVNILGHIFEQSLTDLEEMNASINDTEFDKKKSKRKKDGVFYTPEYITRYIVENTLGKLCSDKKTELKIESETVVVNPRKLTKQEQSYKEILLNYREWLTHLKILDPACGSGAFLNQALEFLIREHTLIRDLLLPYEDLMIGYEVEKSILEHNLYGVDINEDAVEIAKLSLWLRTAHKGRELINLGAKIKCGNSLISDRSVAENAFVWEDEFPEVFAQGGFDVVIGNPPYGAQLSEKHKKYFYERFKTVEYQLDTYLLFIEKSIDLLKPDSLIGFIMPNTWMSSLFAKKIRNFITYKVTIPEITHYDYFVFEDATVEADTYFFKTTEPLNNQITIKIKNKISEKSHIVNQEIWQKNGEPINIYETMELQIIKAKMLDSTPLGEITQIVQGTKPFQVNKGVPKQTKEILEKKPFVSEIKNDDTFLPLLRGSLMERYSIHWSNNYWISYGEWLAEPRLSAKFDCDEKLVIRQTSDSLIATYDNQQFIARDNLYVIRNDEKNINLKYLLALINSKLLTWFYRNIINPEEGKALAQVKRGHLQILPIKRSSADDETQFINFVDEILNAKETLKKYKKHFDSLSAIDKIEIKEATEKLEARVVECEKEIDGMVYALYGLSADEIRIVEGKV
ncbi:MAG TPA: TaqI-like C-terminal specificity domain-containing protein [Sulfuricurvum sp.]|nr:MAG: hypothetical protein B7X89_06475 [Sulfuricurvum sp. 17-40-25]HQS66946.1 TaqI-like C-terminal specificity domain-containing protein [Sulfuricurvum sp.]